MSNDSAASWPRGSASSPPPSTHPFCAFDSFVVDRVRGLLWQGDQLLPLPRKSFEVLAVLVDRADDVVEKKEIFESAWPDTVVEDNTLARHIATLRRVLHEKPDQHAYITTISGHGYRFVAPLTFFEQDPRRSAAPAPIDVPSPSSGPDVVPLDPPSADNPSTSRRGIKWMSAAAAISLVAGAAAAWFWTRSPVTDASRSSANARSLRQLTFAWGGAALESDPALSPAGSAIAYTSHAMGNADVWVQPLQGGEPTRLTKSAAHDWQAQWAPDGTRLVFRSERDGGGLYVINLDGSEEHQLTSFGYEPRWSPDGTEILFLDTSLEGKRHPPQIYVVDTSGGNPELVRPEVVREFESLDVAWFPTGRRVSLWGRRPDAMWQFVTVELDTDKIVSSVPTVDGDPSNLWDLALSRFAWAPSARFLFFEGESQGTRNLWRIPVDPDTLAWQGPPERLTTGAGSDRGLALAASGHAIAFTALTQRTVVWSFPFDPVRGQITGRGEPATSGRETEGNPVLSADGTKVVYQLRRGPRQELWQRSLSDGLERLLLADASMRSNPHLSRDGSRVAYIRTNTQHAADVPARAVVVLPTSGGGERVVANVDRSSFTVTDWSPDSQWLLGTCAAPLKAICLLPTTESRQGEASIRILASDPSRHLYAPRLSPDQRWISFHSLDEKSPGATRLYVTPLAGGMWIPVTDGRSWDDKARWAPDGKTLYFVSNRSGFLNVWGRHLDPATGRPVGETFRVTSFESPNQMLAPSIRGMEIGISADRLVVPVTEASGHIWLLTDIDR